MVFSRPRAASGDPSPLHALRRTIEPGVLVDPVGAPLRIDLILTVTIEDGLVETFAQELNRLAG